MGRTRYSAPTRSRPAIRIPTRRSRVHISRGRQNEPAIVVDPRNTSVLLGSSNDYCGVYNRGLAAGAVGPIWLGYYRSENSGASFVSSLVPGYPDDSSPYAALSQARTASAGDPVIAWDAHGRAFFGSESSDDPAGSKKTFGDVFVARFRNPGGPDAADTTKDGLEYYGTTSWHTARRRRICSAFSTTRRRSRPTAREACAMGTSTSRGRASTATARTDLLRALDRPRRRPSARRMKLTIDAKTFSSRISRSRQTATST